MLTEEQVREEIKRLEGLQEKYHKQLVGAAKTSSTLTVMGICDGMNIAEAWMDALGFVLEEEKKKPRLATLV